MAAFIHLASLTCVQEPWHQQRLVLQRQRVRLRDLHVRTRSHSQRGLRRRQERLWVGHVPQRLVRSNSQSENMATLMGGGEVEGASAVARVYALLQSHKRADLDFALLLRPLTNYQLADRLRLPYHPTRSHLPPPAHLHLQRERFHAPYRRLPGRHQEMPAVRALAAGPLQRPCSDLPRRRVVGLRTARRPQAGRADGRRGGRGGVPHTPLEA